MSNIEKHSTLILCRKRSKFKHKSRHEEKDWLLLDLLSGSFLLRFLRTGTNPWSASHQSILKTPHWWLVLSLKRHNFEFTLYFCDTIPPIRREDCSYPLCEIQKVHEQQQCHSSMSLATKCYLALSPCHMFSLAQAATEERGRGWGLSLHISNRLTELIRDSASWNLSKRCWPVARDNPCKKRKILLEPQLMKSMPAIWDHFMCDRRLQRG